MEHFIRIAFWIVTLAGCLSAQPISKSETPGIIEGLNTTVTCEDLTLYAPKDMKKECFTKALNCYFKELNGTASLECEDPDGSITKALIVLDRLIGQRENQTTSTECAMECEQDAEVPFSTFVKNLETLFQQVNSEA